MLSTDHSLLSVDGVRVAYRTDSGETVAVDDVSFTVAAGERVAIVGESGSGKTATCLAIAGLLTHPDAQVSARTIRFKGEDIRLRDERRLPSRIPGLAMIFQDAMTSLDPLWTIGSQLRAVIRNTRKISRSDATSEAESWLRRVGLDDVRRIMRARPGQLSGGMRQRVMIAMVLASGPELVIADEPTSALDAALARSAMELLVALTAEQGIGLIVVTHDIHLCHAFCDRILVMYGGKLVESGLSELLSVQSAHPYTQGLLASVPTLTSALSGERLSTIPEATSGERFARTGCVFQNRCALRTEACAESPALRVVGDGHRSACWHAEAAIGGPQLDLAS